MLLIATNVPCAPSATGTAVANALHTLEERPHIVELGQGDDVRGRHHEHVPGEERRPVEERDDGVVAVDDLSVPFAGHDGAERTGGHFAILA